MGLFAKLKNLFFEEELVEVKNETLKEELAIPKNSQIPKKELKDEMDDIISERELFKSETTFKFPVIFEDEDFIEEKKINKNKNVIDFETIKIKEQQKKDNKEAKKTFRVSPIISPVYGILDKNYKKEDVVTKEKASKISDKKVGRVDFDIIRKKAYGTLSDVIEQTIEPDDNKTMFFNLKSEENKSKIDDTNLLYEMSEEGGKSIMDDITFGAAEENYHDFGLEYNIDGKIKDIEVTHGDNLFDLIDSMYEKKEEL